MGEEGWPAPAKLNLFLHITGRRADGYHLLQTVFQFLERSDTIYFSVRSDGLVRRTSELSGVAPENDLVVRAARALQAATGTSLGADIRVDKCLPMGGGLGGGSSDAATTLAALNRLWDTGLSERRLAEIGLGLGADVPIFLHGRAAWAEGVGEQFEPIDLPEPWFVVITPGTSIATATLFSDSGLTRDCPPITIRDFLAGAGHNVFEPVVRRRYPPVAEALDWLGRYGPARLTGTGACIFAPFGQREDAEWVLARLPSHWQGFVARGRNHSPLLDALHST